MSFRTINPEQLGSAVRQILLVVSSVFVARGWGTQDVWDEFIPGIVILVTAGYGLWKHRDKGLVESAAKVPAVSAIIAPGTDLASDPAKPKIVNVVETTETDNFGPIQENPEC